MDDRGLFMDSLRTGEDTPDTGDFSSAGVDSPELIGTGSDIKGLAGAIVGVGSDGTVMRLAGEPSVTAGTREDAERFTGMIAGLPKAPRGSMGQGGQVVGG